MASNNNKKKGDIIDNIQHDNCENCEKPEVHDALRTPATHHHANEQAACWVGPTVISFKSCKDPPVFNNNNIIEVAEPTTTATNDNETILNRHASIVQDNRGGSCEQPKKSDCELYIDMNDGDSEIPRIFAMAIGMKEATELIQFDQEPYKSVKNMKSTYKPSNLDLYEEIVRRAKLQGTTIPRYKNKKECEKKDWLMRNPTFKKEDVDYVCGKIKAFRELLRERKKQNARKSECEDLRRDGQSMADNNNNNCNFRSKSVGVSSSMDKDQLDNSSSIVSCSRQDGQTMAHNNSGDAVQLKSVGVSSSTREDKSQSDDSRSSSDSSSNSSMNDNHKRELSSLRNNKRKRKRKKQRKEAAEEEVPTIQTFWKDVSHNLELLRVNQTRQFLVTAMKEKRAAEREGNYELFQFCQQQIAKASKEIKSATKRTTKYYDTSSDSDSSD